MLKNVSFMMHFVRFLSFFLLDSDFYSVVNLSSFIPLEYTSLLFSLLGLKPHGDSVLLVSCVCYI